MAQILHLGNGSKATVDIVYGDGGSPARQAAMGGTIIQLAEGVPPKPMIARHGDSFFYLTDRLDPVTDPAHVQHLPPKDREAALRFIERTSGKPVKAPVVSDKQAEKLTRQNTRQAPKGKPIKDLEGLRQEAGAHVVGVAD